MHLPRKSAVLALVAALSFGLAANAHAATRWQKEHPRRAEVSHRLANQNRHIDHKRREGEMTRAQAARLHREDARIRHEERVMASRDGGHLTKQDDARLNRQENAVSRQILSE